MRTDTRQPSKALLLGAAALLVVAACKRPSGFQGYKPATLEHAKESQLNRIVLTKEAEQRLSIRTEPLRVQPMPRRRTVGAEVISPPGTSAVITAPVAGTVLPARAGAGLPVPGTKVERGQVVLRFAPMVAPGRSVQADAQRDVESARSRAENTRRQAERLKQLGQEGIGNQSVYEEVEAQARVAEAELSAASSRLQGIKGSHPLAADVTLPLKAPDAAVVMRLLVTEGQTVAQGTPLFEIADLRKLWLRVPVYVGDLPELDRSAEVGVQPLGSGAGDARLTARPLPVPAAGRAETASAELYFELQAAEHGLTPGQRVLVSLALLGDREPRKVIPHSAVLYDLHGSTWAYARVAPLSYERRRIELDHVQGELAVLQQAPAEGTELVTVGATELFGTEFGAGK
jgi:multidrug efflux pump subunit AcrA (membrane-fusion protein)